MQNQLQEISTLAKKFDLTRERGHFLCSLEAYLRKTNLHRLNKAKKTSDGKDCSPVIKLHGVHTKSHPELSGCYSKTDADPAHHVGGEKASDFGPGRCLNGQERRWGT